MEQGSEMGFRHHSQYNSLNEQQTEPRNDSSQMVHVEGPGNGRWACDKD